MYDFSELPDMSVNVIFRLTMLSCRTQEGTLVKPPMLLEKRRKTITCLFGVRLICNSSNKKNAKNG